MSGVDIIGALLTADDILDRRTRIGLVAADRERATAAAEDTSITESRPNPINAVEDACAPAVSATAASITL